MYAAPNVILAVAPTGNGRLINVGTGGSPPAIDPKMVELWQLLDQGMALSAATASLADTYREPVDVIRRDCAPAVADLRRARMLTRRRQHGRLRNKVNTNAPPPTRRIVANDDNQRAPARYRMAAWAGYLVTLGLSRLPYRLTLWSMLAMRSARTQHPTVATTSQLVAITRRIVRRGPGWAECHEVSVPAYIAGALLGRAPRWALDATFSPFELHASLEVADTDTAVDDAPQPCKQRLALIRI